MKPHYTDDAVTLYHGDCLEVLAELPDNSVDSVVTDPPYGLEFMGKDWDAPWKQVDALAAGRMSGDVIHDPAEVGGFQDGAGGNPFSRSRIRYGREGGAMLDFQQWCQQWATELLRVLKPGGHLLAFGGTRTWHRLAVAIEDAGFEIRDNIAWIYGSGFPKSLNVATAVDKHRTDHSTELLPDEQRFCQWMRESSGLTEQDAKRLLGSARFITGVVEIVNTATVDAPRMGRRAMVPTAAAWSKVRPMLATEPPEWVEDLVKAPPTEQTLADWNPGKGKGTTGDNEWAGWGTALKPAFEPIVVARKPLSGTVAANVLEHGTGALNIDGCRVGDGSDKDDERWYSWQRRESVLQESKGMHTPGRVAPKPTQQQGRWPANVLLDPDTAAQLDKDSGTSVSRVGKPRGAASGDGWGMTATGSEYDDEGGASRFFPVFRYNPKAPTDQRPTHNGIAHPTVKPLDLMRWLVRLVTPPGGTVLEPFAGSGTTAEACIHEHLRCIAIERETDYLPLIVNRLTKPIEIGFDFT